MNTRQSVNKLIPFYCHSFQLHNFVHRLTSLAALVYFFAVQIHHYVGAMTGDGFDLAISATGFQ